MPRAPMRRNRKARYVLYEHEDGRARGANEAPTAYENPRTHKHTRADANSYTWRATRLIIVSATGEGAHAFYSLILHGHHACLQR